MSRGIMILLVAVILILAVVLALVLLRYKKMEKFADRAMIQANDIMEQLILGREVKYFSENEDSLLGKFQARAGRLYDIHSAPESRILVELLEYEMYIRINVCSQGTKVEREEFARVFQRFYRGRNAEEQEGVGLGLYLAREIVNGQRGYMKGEYELEKGNVFSVFLRR